MTEMQFTQGDRGTSGVSVLMPLPDRDFDPSEAALPWSACASQGWNVAIATEHGQIAQADPHKLRGPLPGLISAGAKARAAYDQMRQDEAYCRPIHYGEIDADRYDALLLPGGDAPGMRQYFENTELRTKVLQFWQQGKLIGAICHGMLVLARTIDPASGRSVLYGHKVTVLPKSLDRTGYLVDSWLLKRGYVMYSSCVADEVRACLRSPEDLSKGPSSFVPYVVCDGSLLTARTYLDAELFAQRFVDELRKRMPEA